MILMPQIFDVTANENARYKRNELECILKDRKNMCLLTVSCQNIYTFKFGLEFEI